MPMPFVADADEGISLATAQLVPHSHRHITAFARIIGAIAHQMPQRPLQPRIVAAHLHAPDATRHHQQVDTTAGKRRVHSIDHRPNHLFDAQRLANDIQAARLQLRDIQQLQRKLIKHIDIAQQLVEQALVDGGIFGLSAE